MSHIFTSNIKKVIFFRERYYFNIPHNISQRWQIRYAILLPGPVSRFNGHEMDRVLLIPLCLVRVQRLNDCSTAWESNEIQIHRHDKG